MLFYLMMMIVTFIGLTVLGELKVSLYYFYGDPFSALAFSLVWPITYLFLLAIIFNKAIVSLMRLKTNKTNKSSLDEES